MGDISAHFDRSEFACKCGCGFDTVDIDLLALMEAVRQEFDKPVIITSGCRCYQHNKDEEGWPDSKHMEGRAADIVVRGYQPFEVYAYFLDALGTGGGLGSYADFTHVDSRSGPAARW